MLHAVAQKKATTFLRQRIGRMPLEDVVTSTIFGPLAFVEPADTLEALALAFDLPLPSWRPTSCEVEFWPRCRDTRIEPDMQVRFADEDGRALTLLVEVKWDAPFGADQALRQWHAFGEGSAHHILLARDRLSITSHLERSGQGNSSLRLSPVAYKRWRGSLLPTTWSEVSGRLRQRSVSKMPTALKRWAHLVTTFLAAMGEKPFTGFVQGFGGPLLPWTGASLFWASAIQWPEEALCAPRERLFWNTETHAGDSDHD